MAIHLYVANNSCGKVLNVLLVCNLRPLQAEVDDHTDEQ